MSLEEKTRSAVADHLAKMSRYTGIDVMPLRTSINKSKPVAVGESDSTLSGKLFYLRKNRQDMTASYNSAQFSNYLTSQKENMEDNVSNSLRTYLNLKKDRLANQGKKPLLEIKKPTSAVHSVTNLKDENREGRERISVGKGTKAEPDQSLASRLTSNRLQTAPSTAGAHNLSSVRPVLQEIQSNTQPDRSHTKRKEEVAIQGPIPSPETPKKAMRKTKVEVRESLDKDISVVKHSVQLDPTRRSTQESGIIKSYAVNTNEGLIRNYNEDRVSIILNIMQSGKQNDLKWPKCAFFGVYDGHCGSVCAEFLRDNLHKYILRNKNFPSNPREALREGVLKAEAEFFKRSTNEKGDLVEKSGSCGLVLLVVDEVCFLANIGDSRAILSKDGGKQAISITRDHKPCEAQEKERILKAGGKIYRTQIQTVSLESDHGEEFEKEEIVNGPYRVFPGRLSVCRTFGDYEAKMPKYGGNPNVVVVEPEIFEIPIDASADFLLLGCDGVFDKFTTEELVERVWTSCSTKNLKGSFHEIAADIVEGIFQDTFQRKAWDNITVILVCFKNLFNSLAKLRQRMYQSEKQPRLTSGLI